MKRLLIAIGAAAVLGVGMAALAVAAPSGGDRADRAAAATKLPPLPADVEVANGFMFATINALPGENIHGQTWVPITDELCEPFAVPIERGIVGPVAKGRDE